jgi:hypothetical protein
MKYFLDTEFNQEVDPVELISIGIVAEDGREFYRIADFDEKRLDHWLRTHVLPNLELPEFDLSEPMHRLPKRLIRNDIEEFLKDDKAIEFWGYFSAYDWFLFTRLWNFRFMPRSFPRICFDLKQLASHLGFTDTNHLKTVTGPPLLPEHNALIDARWNKQVYGALMASARAAVLDGVVHHPYGAKK